MGVDTPRGRVVRDAEGVRLEFERTWPVPVEDVWDALTTPERCARWYGRWTGDPTSGSVLLTMSEEQGATPETVGIERCEPPHALVVVVPPPGDGPWRLDVALTPHEGGTRLRFVHRLAEPYDATGIGPGWHFYLDRLEAEVAGRPVDQQWDDYAGLGEEYPLPA